MISCIIIDDEQHAIDVLENYTRQLPYLLLEGSFTKPLEALALLHTKKIDLVFLDIQMPDISGIDFIKALHGKSKVILTTAYSEFAAEGFELEVIDYLLKPVPLPRFLKACQRATAIIKGTTDTTITSLDDDYIFVKTETKGKLLKINLADIDYIEGMKNYVAIYHKGQKTMALLNMKDLEERLPSQHFMRIQKSFIIALRKVTGIEGNMVKLNGIAALITLGELYKPVFMERLKHKLMD
jgi:two-component system, LytTR family, response regulator